MKIHSWNFRKWRAINRPAFRVKSSLLAKKTSQAWPNECGQIFQFSSDISIIHFVRQNRFRLIRNLDLLFPKVKAWPMVGKKQISPKCAMDGYGAAFLLLIEYKSKTKFKPVFSASALNSVPCIGSHRSQWIRFPRALWNISVLSAAALQLQVWNCFPSPSDVTLFLDHGVKTLGIVGAGQMGMGIAQV